MGYRVAHDFIYTGNFQAEWNKEDRDSRFQTWLTSCFAPSVARCLLTTLCWFFSVFYSWSQAGWPYGWSRPINGRGRPCILDAQLQRGHHDNGRKSWPPRPCFYAQLLGHVRFSEVSNILAYTIPIQFFILKWLGPPTGRRWKNTIRIEAMGGMASFLLILHE